MASSDAAVINQNYPELVSLIKQSPIDVAVQLKREEIFPSAVWTFITSQQNSTDEKAIKIVDTVLEQVKHNSQMFSTFISALKAAGPWTKPVVDKLCTHKPLLHSGK